MKNINILYLRSPLCILVLTFGFAFSAYAQENSYAIRFQNNNVSLQENIETFEWKQLDKNLAIDKGYYTWIQFYETPSQRMQDEIKSRGIDLINFIGSKAYMAYVPSGISPKYLRNIGVRSIELVQDDYKLSENLRLGIIGDWAVKGENILVTLQHHDRVTSDFVIKDLANKQISVKEEYKGHAYIGLSIPNNCLKALSSLPYVRFIDVAAAPPEKEDHRARVLHRSAGLDTQTGVGRDYTGKGIGVLVRDDGFVGPHIDFKGRIDNSRVSAIERTHGDGVAGVMAGAGNLNPDYRGMAAESNIYVAYYDPFFLDSATAEFVLTERVQITNSSYSDFCNSGYNIRAQIVDTQAKNTLNLLHVFSSGNSNGSNCGYGAGDQWGNVTGGHKVGKNVIAVANVFFDGSIAATSSRGPASDGRIKPDISASGRGQISTTENNAYRQFGGTSAASPGIAGVSAQLYELYGDFNNGEFPQSALIKAAMLNTANEAGTIGPDFIYGWGIVNGLRAGRLIEEERYLSDTAIQGATNTHTISVPEGTTQVRFMLYWSDVPASSGADKALINDLDLVVTDPSSSELLPWILDSTPNPVTLNNPATNGEDHLNNMEQVLINTPQAGDYTISVSGFDVPMGPQEYFVLYEIIEDQLTVTHPNEGELLTPGSEEVIHWDAINTTDDFVVEYSIDGGLTYTTISTVSADENLLVWEVPADVTGEAKVRVTSGDISDESDGLFSIANQVVGLELDSVCLGEASFSWDPVDGATSYDLYILGDKFMEIVGTSTTNSITVPILDPDLEMWYAITASNLEEGWESKRTVASFYQGGLVNCLIDNELGLTQIVSNLNDFSIVCGDPSGEVRVTIKNNGILDQTGFGVSYQLSGQDPVEEVFTDVLAAGEEIDYVFASTLDIPSDNGVMYNLEVNVDLEEDEFLNNNSLMAEFFVQTTSEELPFEESFEEVGFPAEGWSVFGLNNEETWSEITVTGIDGEPTTVGFVNNFEYEETGIEDVLMTTIFDLNVIDPRLQFDLAKAQVFNSGDGLRVDISLDCGETFTSIYEKNGIPLRTTSNFIDVNWEPVSIDDWRTEIISLTQFEEETAMFRIVNVRGDGGNNTYIDNFRVVEAASILSVEDTTELLGVLVYPNPASEQVNIALPSTINGNTVIKIVNSFGQVVKKMENDNSSALISMDISSFSKGLYFIEINNQDRRTVEKIIVR